jgi:hypothetical protein
VVFTIKDVAAGDGITWLYLRDYGCYRHPISARNGFFFLSHFIFGNNVYPVYAGA